jgi:pantoate--beta-alanine ligase
MHIIPTTRDPATNLALSSRNAYLSPGEMSVAPTLYQALSAAKSAFESEGQVTGEHLVSIAREVVVRKQEELRKAGAEGGGGVDLKLDYVEVFDKDTFQPVRGTVERGRELVLAGAVWVGKTRLIDNLLLGWDM